jgi:ATP phosphoribosyltransferase
MLRVAVPNKGALAGPASEMLVEAGYRQRNEQRDLTVLDQDNDVEFFFLRPKDIAIYVGSGELDFGITGLDLAEDSGARFSKRLELGFGMSKFRYAAPAGREWGLPDLNGKRLATSYPRLVRQNLASHNITADVIRLDGAVEISIQLGVADVIADVVGSGRTLRQHNLVAFGPEICESQAVLIEGADTPESPAKAQLAARLRGVVRAQNYLMIDYDCPKALLDKATELTPGLESPTVSPLAEKDWFAVRSMVPRKEANQIMDQLAEIGAKAVVAFDIRSCRL